MYRPKTHVVQSKKWGEVKTKSATPAVLAGGVQYTKHKIPGTPYFFGYAPKINPREIDFDQLKQSAKDNNCIAINLDCPNVTKDEPDAKELEKSLAKHCQPAAKDTFAKYNILLDLTPSEEELLANMHPKTRYNTRYAQKHGITVRQGTTLEDLNIFLQFQKSTADRQKFFVHPNHYYKNIWDVFYPEGMVKILIAELEGKPVSAWMFFVHDEVLYYPYGGWSGEHQKLFPNNLVCWEAIRLGKTLGCKAFDMWGAAKNPEDQTDSWYGFTKFKLGFGGTHVEHINSYDLVLNPVMYSTFNLANKIRWALLRLLK